ncbi:hypothetical protein CAPTEDRAFT_185934 [Capitella teleta]|uniref:Uncharacterized protein n=1 Tax=Capitella teleta TaxID=283909 RepID=R7UY83_CAPTE|nr:hypothetical protein CAPTEDRAFT_185934 [Capitella teleta]|eukprot:ELU11264.1 hypothetical protein CAPTEDRAFT_185934 [Capitella teleta]
MFQKANKVWHQGFWSLKIATSPIKVCEGVSDHLAVSWALPLGKHHHVTRQVTYRRTKTISPGAFSDDILSSPMSSISPGSSLDDLTDLYFNTLRGLLDQHAPEKTRRIPICLQPEWYSLDIRTAKQKRRRLERLWVITGLTVHKEIYQDAKRNVNKVVRQA